MHLPESVIVPNFSEKTPTISNSRSRITIKQSQMKNKRRPWSEDLVIATKYGDTESVEVSYERNCWMHDDETATLTTNEATLDTMDVSVLTEDTSMTPEVESQLKTLTAEMNRMKLEMNWLRQKETHTSTTEHQLTESEVDPKEADITKKRILEKRYQQQQYRKVGPRSQQTSCAQVARVVSPCRPPRHPTPKKVSTPRPPSQKYDHSRPQTPTKPRDPPVQRLNFSRAQYLKFAKEARARGSSF